MPESFFHNPKSEPSVEADTVFRANYLVPGAPNYREQAKVYSRRLDIIEYDSLMLVGVLDADEPGWHLNEHDSSPRSVRHRAVEAAFVAWLGRTNGNERVLIIDRAAEEFTDRGLAISARANNRQIASLAKSQSVECLSGDVRGTELAHIMKRAGASSLEISLLWSISALPSFALSKTRPEYLGAFLAHQAGLAGVEGFSSPSDPEYHEFDTAGWSARELQQTDANVASKLIPRWNNFLGRELFVVEPSGIDLAGIDIENSTELAGRLMPLCSVNSTGPLSVLAQQMAGAQDLYLFRIITERILRGQHPFVIFGTSHIVSIKPALDALYGDGIRKAG